MKIGIMQGRLVRPSGNRIQEFPSKLWREELKIASKLNINLIEWVIDKKSIKTNPIIKNLDEVIKLTSKNDIQVESISDDYFLQEKRNNILENKILNHLEKLFNLVKKIGISIYVLPFLERTSLKNYTFNNQIDILNKIEPLIPKDLSVCLETDLNPKNLETLIKSLDTKKFSINYDIGNSAFEGYDYLEEFESYFPFIANIHVKDRAYQGPTVPLGQGDANIQAVLKEIKKRGYKKNLILQAARQDKIEDTTVIETYFKMVNDVICKE